MSHSSLSAETKRLHYFCLLIILACTTLLYLPYLDLASLVNEETRRAVVAKELLEREQYLVATIAGESYTAKPLLFNWLIIAASAMTNFEVTEWSARFPSVVGASLLFIAMYWLTRTWWSGQSRLFFIAVMILSPQIMRKATAAEIDIVFTLFVNISLFVWFHYYQKQQMARAWLLSAVYIALAYLCKREAALLFYFLSIVGYLIWSKQTHYLKSRHFLGAIGIIFVGISIWLLPIITEYGFSLFVAQTANEINARSADGGIGDYLLSSGLYPIEVFLALLPSSLLLVILLFKKYRVALKQHFGEKFSFCLFIVLINLIPFILLGKSNVRYYLPMFVPVFILATMIFSHWSQLSLSSRLRNNVSYFAPIVLQALVIIAFSVIYFKKAIPTESIYVLPAIVIGSFIFLIRFASQRDDGSNSSPVYFLYFCIVMGLAVRLFDLSYTQPRINNNTNELRNIPRILSAVNDISRSQNKQVLASPSTSHALYFYDDEKLIKPITCNLLIQENHLILTIVKNSEFKKLPNKLADNIVWHSTYKKSKTIFIYKPTRLGKPPSHCANQSLGRK